MRHQYDQYSFAMLIKWLCAKALFLVLSLASLSTTWSCRTPLGFPGRVMPFRNCTQLLQLTQRYRNTTLPERVRTFLQLSHLYGENGQDFVCCGDIIDLTESDGAAILRNFHDDCGDNISKRISYGIPTTLDRYAWLALLIYNSPDRFKCGGSLVTHRYVLTAAHCVTSTKSKLIGVRLGEHNILTNPDCEVNPMVGIRCKSTVQDVDIDRVISHPLFCRNTLNHDIALIRLKEYVAFHRSVRPICLPDFQRQYDDIPYGIISGWGATENGTKSSILMEAQIPVHSISHCQSIYHQQNIDWTKRICSVSEDNIQACKGDSGGPLFLGVEGGRQQASKENFKFIQIGIISLGSNWCDNNDTGNDINHLPSIFTNVAAYMDWIMENMEM